MLSFRSALRKGEDARRTEREKLTAAAQSLHRRAWPCATSSCSPTNACASSPIRWRRSTPPCASSPRTCSRPCTTRPASGLPPSRSASPCGVVTMDLAKKDDEKEPQVFINPEITWSSDEMKVHEEGCLSIPEYYEEVERPAKVRVKYLDLDGKPQRGRGRRHSRDLPAARDRPSKRRIVHRPSVEAEARPGHQEIHQDRQAGGGLTAGPSFLRSRGGQHAVT